MPVVVNRKLLVAGRSQIEQWGCAQWVWSERCYGAVVVMVPLRMMMRIRDCSVQL